MALFSQIYALVIVLFVVFGVGAAVFVIIDALDSRPEANWVPRAVASVRRR